MKPKLLDLFCGAGGAGVGYHRAGFDVVGVDLNPMPNYPFVFYQADALDFLNAKWQDFDAIHASPPCQAWSAMRHMPDAKVHSELIEPTRAALVAISLPWVIENVMGAPLRDSTVLCGTMFDLGAAGFVLQRHRQFESSIPLAIPHPCRHTDRPTIGVYGGHVRCRSAKFWRNSGADFPGYDKKALARESMGIDWMTGNELSQAIPPAYTEFIGAQLLTYIERRRLSLSGDKRLCP